MTTTIEKELKTLTTDIRGFITKHDTRYESLQKQVDAIDFKMCGQVAHGGLTDDTLVKAVTDRFDEIQEAISTKRKLRINVKSFGGLQVKTTITSDALGRMTTGVLPIDRQSDIVGLPMRRFFVRVF